MNGQVVDLVVLIIVALVAGGIGLGIGIVVMAPRIGRAVDRTHKDEEASDGRD
jgi:hypothetical protein